jgi:hypothetical protein
MHSNQKGFSFLLGFLVLLVIIIVVIAGWYIRTQRGLILKPGVDIEVITGEGGMPPGYSRGKILSGEKFTVVFTEPFASLENWQASKEIRKVTTSSGKTSINIPTGKYGVYYIYKGQKTLYDNLTLENPRNDIQRDKQGLWYIEVHNLQRLKLSFSVNKAPS